MVWGLGEFCSLETVYDSSHSNLKPGYEMCSAAAAQKNVWHHMRRRPTFIQTDLGNSPCNRNGIKQSGKKKAITKCSII